MKSQGRLFEEFPEPKQQSISIEKNANAATDERVIAQVHAIAKAIPSGRVLSYGAVGARCNPPISGYICGRIMIHSHESVPWWRVVGKDGALRISKRNPLLARDQREKLENEGVEFDEGGWVQMEKFADD